MPMTESGDSGNDVSLWTSALRPQAIDDQVLSAWRQSPLLTDVDKRIATRLVKLTHVRQYRTGEFLFQQGEAGVAAGLIIQGRVHILSGDRQIATLESGDLFGEVALLEDAPRTASARADGDVLVSFLVRYQLEEFVRHRPLAGAQIMTNLARQLALRLHHSNSGAR